MTALKARTKAANGMAPVHPGEILREEFLNPLGMSGDALAAAMHIPFCWLRPILDERRGITAAMALRLSKALGTSPEFWMNLQQTFDLKNARAILVRVLGTITPIIEPAQFPTDTP